MNDHLLRLLSKDGHLRAAAVTTTGISEELRQWHRTDPTATVALSQMASATALCSSLLKGQQRLALSIEGNGPLIKIHAETDANGCLRATVKNPRPDVPPVDDQFDLATALGRAGFLHVIKDLGLKEPYRGMVQLQRSDIAHDLAYYFTTSEQTPSSVMLGAQLSADLTVAAAGGLLIQAMPGCPAGHLEALEKRLVELGSLTDLLRAGQTPAALLERVFDFTPVTTYPEQPLQLRCRCSRDYSRRLLRALDTSELEEVAAAGDGTTVTCEYCRKEYRFDADELGMILARKAALQ